MQPTKSNDRHVDISACLDAVNQYDADYHRERGDPEVYKKTTYVLVGEYVQAKCKKASTHLLGQGFFALTGVCAVLLLANIAHNICEWQAAQPPILPSPAAPTHIGSVAVYPGANVPHALPPDVVPLPEHWAGTNLALYLMLLAIGGLSYSTGGYFARQAREITIGVPIQAANTADLPAADSLVRASSEPITQQWDVLLRSAAGEQERHEEQLLRVVGEQK